MICCPWRASTWASRARGSARLAAGAGPDEPVFARGARGRRGGVPGAARTKAIAVRARGEVDPIVGADALLRVAEHLKESHAYSALFHGGVSPR